MEFAEALGRVAQNYGIGAAAAAAVALLLFRLYFARYFDKHKEQVSREDIDQLLRQLAVTRRELEGIKAQLSRVHWLTQQQWIHGRCVNRLTEMPPQAAEAERASGGTSCKTGGPNS